MTTNNFTPLTAKAILDLLEQLMKINSVKVTLLTELQRRIRSTDPDTLSDSENASDSLKGILTDAIIMLTRTSSKDATLIEALRNELGHSNIGKIDLDLAETAQIISRIRELIKS